MKMNIGTAVRIRFSARPPKIRDGTEARSVITTKSLKMTPRMAKAKPTPPSTKATGKPVKRNTASAKNMKIGRSSTKSISVLRAGDFGDFILRQCA